MHHSAVPERAGEVGDVDQRPVAQQLRGRDPALRPGHHDQVVAGEQLGPADHHQHQAEREGDARRACGRPEAEALPVMTSVEYIAPNAMKAPASTPSARVWHRRQRRLLDPDLLDQTRDLGGRIGVLRARRDGGRRRTARIGIRVGRSLHGIFLSFIGGICNPSGGASKAFGATSDP